MFPAVPGTVPWSCFLGSLGPVSDQGISGIPHIHRRDIVVAIIGCVIVALSVGDVAITIVVDVAIVA